MIRASVHHFDMNVGSGVMGEAAEEILKQFRLQIADQHDGDGLIVHQKRPTAEIHCGHGERFVHRLQEVAGAIDTAAVTKSLREQIAQDNAGVFYGMVLVDIKISAGFEFQIKTAMLREQFQHVVKKSDAGRDSISP